MDDELAVRMLVMVHVQSNGLLTLFGLVATDIASGKSS